MQKLIKEIKDIVDSYAFDSEDAVNMFHDIGKLLLAYRFEQDIKQFSSVTDSVDEILRLNKELAEVYEIAERSQQIGMQIAEAAISAKDADTMHLLVDKLKDI